MLTCRPWSVRELNWISTFASPFGPWVVSILSTISPARALIRSTDAVEPAARTWFAAGWTDSLRRAGIGVTVGAGAAVFASPTGVSRRLGSGFKTLRRPGRPVVAGGISGRTSGTPLG